MKLSLFPMTKEQCAIVRYPELLKGYTLAHLLVPDFFCLDGANISQIDGGDTANLTITNYTEAILADCDVFFVDYDENMVELSLYKEVISTAQSLGKEVILSRKLCMSLGISKTTENELITNTYMPYQLYEISVPVITVLTQGARTDQFATELALRKHFLDQGYKVSQIGSGEAGLFLGFAGVPNFMHEQYSVYDKTIMFNHYVKKLIDAEQPDLLILGVPDAIMKYNDKLLNGLGFMPFTICSAVKADVSVLCMYYGEYYKLYFDEMEQHGLYRLDTPIEFFCLSNSVYTPEFGSGVVEIKFIDLDSQYVLDAMQNKIDAGKHHLFNALDNNSVKDACVAIEKSLVGNVHYV